MIKLAVKRALGGLRCAVGKLKDKGPLIIAYHRFTDIIPVYDIKGTVSNGTAADLSEEIKFLKETFRIVSMDEMMADINKPLSLRETAVLTFDDGYRDNYEYVYPVLRKHNVPASIFITCNIIDNKDMLWFDRVAFLFGKLPAGEYRVPFLGKALVPKQGKRRASIIFAESLKPLKKEHLDEIIGCLEKAAGVKLDEALFKALNLYLNAGDIKTMSADGVCIGAHTLSHCILNRVSPENAEREMVESKRILESITGRSVDYFSYPDGKIEETDRYLVDMAARCGYKAAVTTNFGLNRNLSCDDALALRRVCGGQNFLDFRYNISKW